MTRLNENNIERFIRENKDKFGDYGPAESHLNNFLVKLSTRLKRIISIAPYLLKVAIATILIFVASVVVWNSYIRKDRHQVSLKNKISLTLEKIRKL